MQPVLDLVWEHLLPAMGRAPLPDDAGAQAGLGDTLANLRLRTPLGQAHSQTAGRISGKHFVLAENPARLASVRFDCGSGETLITLGNDRGEQRIACGHGCSVRGTISLGPQDG